MLNIQKKFKIKGIYRALSERNSTPSHCQVTVIKFSF